MTLTARILELLDRYCGATGRSPATVAALICNQSTLFSRLRAGGSCQIDTWERAVQWFSDNWPAGAEWPDAVDRPTPTDDAEGAAA